MAVKHRSKLSRSPLTSAPPSLRPQFISSHKSFLDDMVLSNGTSGTITSSAMTLVHRAEADEGAYGRLVIDSVRHVEDYVNDDIFGAENAASPSYVFFMYNGGRLGTVVGAEGICCNQESDAVSPLIAGCTPALVHASVFCQLSLHGRAVPSAEPSSCMYRSTRSCRTPTSLRRRLHLQRAPYCIKAYGRVGTRPSPPLPGDYIYNEGDAILGSMTMEYVLLAVAGVGLVLALTLPSPRAVLLMMLAVGLVDYCLFGEMFMINIRFNQVSVINMIMATGLAVDYSVYFAQVGKHSGGGGGPRGLAVDYSVCIMQTGASGWTRGTQSASRALGAGGWAGARSKHGMQEAFVRGR